MKPALHSTYNPSHHLSMLPATTYLKRESENIIISLETEVQALLQSIHFKIVLCYNGKHRIQILKFLPFTQWRMHMVWNLQSQAGND